MMTDQVDDIEQARLDRIARLAARRATGPSTQTRSPSARRRRRHPAQRSRIVAAGIGATTMLGIVTMLGVANAAEGQSSSALVLPTPVPAAPSITPSITTPTAPIVSTSPPAVATSPAPAVDASPTPAVIELTARPVVRVVAPTPTSTASASAAPQPAPVATTSGSS